jgi:hypothetical protein
VRNLTDPARTSADNASTNSSPTERNVRKHPDSAADQVWKEKLVSYASPWEGLLLLALILVLLFAV